MSNASLSVLLYLFSALDRLLLAKVMSLSILSGVMSLGQLLLFLFCIRLAPTPTPDVSISKYNA